VSKQQISSIAPSIETIKYETPNTIAF